MRITQLKVDGFGVWSGLELSELSDQLNVFYGPNEAGKTTLMQFVRSVLYGYSDARRARYLPPLRPGRPGGTLRAMVDGKNYLISRHADTPGEAGDLSLQSDEGPSVRDPRALSVLLGEVDEAVFKNVFAIGLREIQELSSLSDTQAADELYNLAMGLDRVSLIDVLKELDTSRDRLLAADDRPSAISQLLTQRHRVQSEIEGLSHASERYLTLAKERQQVADEINRLQNENEVTEREAREHALVRELADRWRRRATIDKMLEAAPAREDLPADALESFEQIGARISSRRRRAKRIKHEARQLRAAIKQLNINPAYAAHGMRIEALGEQRHWIVSLKEQLDTHETELLELEGHRDAGTKQLGATGKGAEPLSAHGLDELHSAANAWRKSRRKILKLREKAAQAKQAAASHQQHIESSLSSTKAKPLSDQLSEAGELVTQLRRRVQLDEKLDQMNRREAELAQLSGEQLDHQLLPTWALGGLGAMFAVGCALVMLYAAGMVLPPSLSASLGWPIGLVGILTAGIAGGAKFGLERNAAGQLESSQQQIQSLTDEIKQAKKERDKLDHHLPRGGGPLVVRLQTAEKALARLEELLPADSQRETAERDADTAATEHETLVEHSRQQHKNWRRLLAQHGLPPDLPPRKLAEHAEHRNRIGSLHKSIDDKHSELRRRRGEFETVAGRIKLLAQELDLATKSHRPLEQLDQMLAELAEQRTRMKRRDEILAQRTALRKRHAKLGLGLTKLRRRRQSLLRATGASNENELRRRLQSQTEMGDLRAERVQLAQDIAQAITGVCNEETLSTWYADPHRLDHRHAELTASRHAVLVALNTATERRGELNQQIKMLVEERQIGQKQSELATIEKRIADGLERWRVLAVCGMMLDAVRHYYQREHQPQALCEASGYLQKLTSGRYVRVWTPLGENVLKVDDREGRSLNVEVLSRGTRETLFLALRLALVSSFGRRGVNLPLVLDDVLVNFDLGRAKAAAGVLRDFAKAGHQILIFTCHEHLARLFKNMKAEVRTLPDNADLHTVVELPPAPAGEETPRRPRRARPETIAEPVEEIEPDELEPTPIPVVQAPVVRPAVIEPPPPEPVVIVPPVFEPAPIAVPVVAVVIPPVAEPVTAPPFWPAPWLLLPPPAPKVAQRFDPPQVSVPVPLALPTPPPAKPRRKQVRRTRRERWSAEEFDGELSDRVRSQDSWEEVSWQNERVIETVEDADDTQTS